MVELIINIAQRIRNALLVIIVLSLIAAGFVLIFLPAMGLLIALALIVDPEELS